MKDEWNVMPVKGLNDCKVSAWQRENPRADVVSYNEYIQAHFKEVKNETKK